MTDIVPVGDPLDPAVIEEAAEALREGEVVGIPADTTYVLVVRALTPGATDLLFEVKRRPRENDLPLLVASLEQILELATALPPAAHRLMDRFWPGPLTLVLPRHPDFAADLGEDELTVGVRIPDHPVPLALCRAVGPLASVAAGDHSVAELTTAAEVAAAYPDDLALVLDGGPSTWGASTVVDATGEEPHLIREGIVAWTDIAGAVTA
jgi:L-threonylcarbamoyladenylate synthase